MSIFNFLFNKRKTKKFKGLIGQFKLEDWWLCNFNEVEQRALIITEANIVRFGVGQVKEIDTKTNNLTEGESLKAPAFVHLFILTDMLWAIKDELLRLKFEKALDILIEPYFIDDFDIKSHVEYIYKDTSLYQYYKSDNKHTIWYEYPAGYIEMYLRHKAKNYYKRRTNVEDLEKCIAICKLLISKSEYFLKYEKLDIELDKIRFEWLKSKGVFKPRKIRAFYAYERYVIILEKEGKHKEALELIYRCINEGWGNDWGNKIEKLEAKLLKED